MAKPKPQLSQTAQTLVGLGLHENEAVLYTLMLTRPPSTVHELAPVAPFTRTLLYHVLNQLVARGLVRVRDNAWRAVYTAEDPTRLYDILAHKKESFEREAERVRAVVPTLKRAYQLAGARPHVRTFDGVVEYQKALEDILITKPHEVYAYHRFEETPIATEVYDHFERTRIARGIHKKILFFESPEALRALEDRPYDDHTHIRSITKKHASPFATNVLLYEGKLLYTRIAGHEPTAVLLEDAPLFEMQKSLFLVLWKQAKDRTLYFVDKNKK